NADGPAVLAADALEGLGLAVPELAAATQADLARQIPGAANLSNPVDLGANASATDYEQALGVVLADTAVDAVLAIFIPPLVTATDDVAAALVRAAAARPAKPVVANFLAQRGVRSELQLPSGRFIPSFTYPDAAALALARVAGYAEWRGQPQGT